MRSLAIIALFALVSGLILGCGSDEGSTPVCTGDASDCFTAPDGGTRLPDGSAQQDATQD